MFLRNLDPRDRVYVGAAARSEPDYEACAYLAFNSQEEHHGILLCAEEVALKELRQMFRQRSMNFLVRELPPQLTTAVCESDQCGNYGFEADAFHRIANEALRVGIELAKEMEATRAKLYRSTRKSRRHSKK